MTRFTIAPPAGFRLAPTVFSHGWCQLLPFNCTPNPLALSRVQQLADGTIVHLLIEADSRHQLTVSTSRSLTSEQQAEVREVISRCLSFEQDLNSFYSLLRQHKGYAWVEKACAGRMLTSPTVWEDLAKTLLTTNTTWTVTRQMVARLVTLGDSSEYGHAFPTPQQVAALSPVALNAHVRAGYRSAYLHELAVRIADGTIDVERWRTSQSLPSKELFKQIRSLKGFGDYAAGSMMRLLGHFDQLGLDSVCRDMFARRHNRGEKAADSAIREHYAHFGEWQGLAVWMDVMREDLEGIV